MAKRIAVVTGANAGIGFQIARQLAEKGLRIVMACRNLDKAKKAQSELLAQVPGAEAVVLPLDLSELASVREFVRQFSEHAGQLDLLVNNAGIVGNALVRNSAGHEMQIATNYLGTFALIGWLLPFFRKDEPTRIVNVGSIANRFGKLALDDLNWENTPYNPWKGYARSKTAMLSFTMELDRRLRQSGSNITALSAHPGFAATDIGKGNSTLAANNAFSRWLEQIATKTIPSPAQAARPIVFAATDENVKGGEYYGPSGFMEIGGKPGKARINPVAIDTAKGKRLWALSEAMTGVKYLSDI